jgi:hypothetical protein
MWFAAEKTFLEKSCIGLSIAEKLRETCIGLPGDWLHIKTIRFYQRGKQEAFREYSLIISYKLTESV